MKYGEKIQQIRCEIPDAPNCPCRFSRCDPQTNPYCEVSRLAERAVVSSKAAGGPGLSERDALLAAFDKMAAWHREQAARRAGTSPEIPVVQTKVPSKKKLAERRAAREGRALTPSWLLEGEAEMDAQIRSWRESDDA